MAKRMNRKTPTTDPAAPTENVTDEVVTEELSAPVDVEEPMETVAVKARGRKKSDTNIEVKVKKVFDDRDLIPCVSVTPGKLYYVGGKSRELYTWADADFVTEVEYRDLRYAIKAKDKNIFKPRFVILDDDVIAEFPELKKSYGALYTTSDLLEILKMKPAQMEKAVRGLPDGIKESLKSLVVSKIDSGEFDSVQRVRVLDNIFGTEMLLKLTE